MKSEFNPAFPSHPIGLLFSGLLMAQIIATVQVYLSNLDLYATVSAVNAAGYLAVPNQKVMANLHRFAPAFLGGLFFTFTIGAGITLGSMAAAWIWVRVFLRNTFSLFFLLSGWGIALLLVNINGFNLMPTLYFLLIPPAVFKLTVRRESRTDIPAGRMRLLFHLVPVPLLALLWFTQFDRAMFLDLRDNLLLSNSWGKKFSDFYYTYTLYPAEAFKSLDQKNIKTCRLADIHDKAVELKLENRLRANGWLPLAGADRVDLKITRKDNNLAVWSAKHLVFQIPLNQFLAAPQKILQKYSQQIDRNRSFRKFTFLSLLIGFPVLIYMVLHAVLYYLSRLIAGRKNAAMTASLTCLLIGIVVLVYFQSTRSGNIDVGNIAQALKSENWQTRVAALKVIQQKKLDIAAYPSYRRLLKSRIPQERYWLARALAFSRRTATYRDLLSLLNDKNTNVQTMALYSLGQRKQSRAIGPILQKIKTSASWYIQMYAYNALRSLGWKQTKSH